MQDQFQAILYVLLLPLIGSLVQALAGGRIVATLGPEKGKRLLGVLAVLPIAFAFLIGVMLTMRLANLPGDDRAIQIQFFDWIKLLSVNIPFEVTVDPLSMTMVLIITGIGALIHLYATGYMAEERDYPRFFTYLNLFIAFMLILVLGGNLAMMFIGWEGVGLCSYLLIGFWYKDLANAKAANKAFIVNRIGDWGLTLGIFLLLMVVADHAMKTGATSDRWLSYDVMLPAALEALRAQPGVATVIALLLFVGACGKSAQFPLYLWLPDAMAGPTPVSALIHAATMVTAGVFLLNRMHVVFVLSPVAGAVVAAIGAFTALFAALVAFGQTDIKKVLAYSTVSQLGFMFIACGAGVYWAGMFHVTTHAFFKALLFLGAGAVIHAMAHDQDMRNYGNLRKYLPITFATMMIGYLAIAGIPPLAGFFSKEAILGGAIAGEHAIVDNVRLGMIAGWLGLLVAMLTAMYMTRMTVLTFWGRAERWRTIEADHSHEHEHEHAADHHGHADADHGEDTHGFFFSDDELASREAPLEHHHALDATHTPREVPISMWLPLAVLAVLSLVGGFILNANGLFEKWLYPAGIPQLGEVSTHPEGVPLLQLSIAAAVLGILGGLYVYRKGLPPREGLDLAKWSPFRRSALNQFGYDSLMVNASVEGGADLAEATWKGIDVGVIDRGVNGIAWFAGALGRMIRGTQTGFVRMYALVMLIGGIVILGMFMYEIARLGGSR